MAELTYICAYYTWLEAMEELTDAEKGRLFVALLEYGRSGARPQLRGNERFVFSAIKWAIDRDKEAYAARCRQNRKNRTTVNDGQPSSTTVHDGDQYKEKEKDKDKEESITTGRKRPGTLPRKERGEYGWVKLTDAELERLVAEFGEAETARAIQYIDESAQSTGNKNKWKDWNLVVRKCIRGKWGQGSGEAASPSVPDVPEGMRQETGPDGRTRWVRI